MICINIICRCIANKCLRRSFNDIGAFLHANDYYWEAFIPWIGRLN